jgi:hypothetical protein
MCLRMRNRENFSELEAFLKHLGATHVVPESFARTPEYAALLKVPLSRLLTL